MFSVPPVVDAASPVEAEPEPPQPVRDAAATVAPKIVAPPMNERLEILRSFIFPPFKEKGQPDERASRNRDE